MILLTNRESYNLLAVKLDKVLAIWPSQLGKETTSLKWIPTHLERDREGDIQDWVSIYQQNFYNAHTIPLYDLIIFLSFCK